MGFLMARRAPSVHGKQQGGIKGPSSSPPGDDAESRRASVYKVGPAPLMHGRYAAIDRGGAQVHPGLG